MHASSFFIINRLLSFTHAVAQSVFHVHPIKILYSAQWLFKIKEQGKGENGEGKGEEERKIIHFGSTAW